MNGYNDKDFLRLWARYFLKGVGFAVGAVAFAITAVVVLTVPMLVGVYVEYGITPADVLASTFDATTRIPDPSWPWMAATPVWLLLVISGVFALLTIVEEDADA